MSSNLLALPFRPVINQNGEFEAGATLTAYNSGTTTLAFLYSDAALSTNLGNPVTADGFGVFPPIYFSDTQPVRVLIEQSDGTTLFDVDPYISTVFEAEAILDQAAAAVVEAEDAAEDAVAAAARAATSEAIAAAFAGPSYANTTAGIAATVDGEYFYVLDSGTVEVYLNDSEVAVLQYSILSASEVESQIAGKADASHTHAISDVTGLQTALDAKATLISPALTGTPTANGIEVGFRKIPRSTTSGTLVADDSAKCVVVAAGITVPASVFAAGDAVTIYNNTTGNITITQGSSLTLRQAATANTGNRTLAQRGLATIWFDSSTVAVISGPGVT